MVFFPPGTPHNLFEGSALRWAKERDGLPTGPAPHTICDIIEAFTADGIEYKVGIQGQILERATDMDGGKLTRIFIEGVTETGPEPDDRKKWVPRDRVTIVLDWRDFDDGWSFDDPVSTEVESSGRHGEMPGSANKTEG